jgi:hypothetical protein
MAWVTGSATDYDDLMDKLKTFLTTNAALVAANQNWIVMKDEIITDRYLYLRGPGLANNDQIHVNIRRFYSAAGGAYNWEFRGATSYDGGLSYENQPGSNETCFFCLSNGTITYWFFANGRRFIVIAKIGTVFVSAYAGFILPYALPSEYPYPLFIGATSYLESRLYSESDYYTSAFWKMGYGYANSVEQRVDSGVQLRLISGLWLPFKQNNAGTYNLNAGNIWPYYSAEYYGNTDLGLGNLTKNADGSYSILPVILYSSTYGTKDVFGELDGVYHVPGIDLNSEDTLTIGGDVYLAFQNVEDVGRNDFAAILRE